jgi:NAD(P)-dependent dehydrogenase (short-subunit alcohol dehydrogenase family)
MSEATPDPLDLTDRVVVVTGGTKGVGRGIALRFLEAGADVVVSARNEPDSPVEHDGAVAGFFNADVRDPEQANALIEFAIDRHGRLDTLVNNAGGGPPAEAATASPRFSEAIIRLNLIAPLVLAQAANAVMQEQAEGGSIVNICSVSGTRPSPGSAAYGAAKAGLLNLTQSLAIEWAPKVRVNAVTPGYIETEQSHLHYGDEAGVAAVASIIPLLRMGRPSDIGDACIFLASPLASYVSGSNLAVHGGGERPPFLAASNAT